MDTSPADTSQPDAQRAFVLIVNPVAGRGRARRNAQALEAALKARGAEVDLSPTTAPGDAGRMAKAAAEQDRIPIICGGDGSIQEAAAALAGTGKVMAAAPGGRCNDLLRALGFPRHDMTAAADRLLTAQPRVLDAVSITPSSSQSKIEDRPSKIYCTVAALGFDAAVSRYVNDARLPFHGKLAYWWGILRTLMRYRPIEARLEGDFGTLEGPLFLAAIANTRCYGGGIPIAPDAEPHNGMLDICVIKPLSRWRAVRKLPLLMKGRHGDLPEVSFLRSKRVEVSADPPAEAWADGEFISSTPFTIEAMPGALSMLW